MFQALNKVLQFLNRDIYTVKIAVVGDVMLDRYYYGEVKRISPEAPVPVTRVLREKEVLGGAGNVAQNLAKLGCNVHLVGITGDDYNRQRLCDMLDESGIRYEGLITVDRPTTTKLRVIGGHQQMLRLDFEEAGDLARRWEKSINNQIASLISQGIDCIILSDYAKGVCTRAISQFLIKEAARQGIPVIVDPKGTDWRKYSGADFITPNLKELTEVTRESLSNNDTEIEKAAHRVRKRYNIQNIIVTRSEKGLSLVNGEETFHIPTRAQEVFDVSGAGDTVIAVFGASVAGGLPLVDASQLANLAAGVAVGKLGTYAVSREELVAALHMFTAISRDIEAASTIKEE